MAVACASGWRADKLLFLTDVEGVRDASGARIPRLSLHESQKLIQEGVAHGGMLAKLNSAHLALHNGLAEVRIARGSDPDVLSRFLSGEPLGTAIMNES
jgi:acetylglutamate kinase